MTDVNNNKFNHTISNKLRYITYLHSRIIEILNEDQDLKRYLSYPTRTPLLKQGVGYDGKMSNQPDITKSLFNTHIYDNQFLDKLVTETTSSVFISNYDNSLKELNERNIFKVDIFVPLFSNELDDFESEDNYTKKRHLEIAIRIINLLDGRNLDDNGKYYFKTTIEGTGRERRFNANSTEYKCYGFDIVVGTMGGRVIKK